MPDPKLRNRKYDDFGDAYNDSQYYELAEKWDVEPRDSQAYLRFVKQASKTQWIHLRLLADFMQIGRMPRDWKDDLKGPTNDNVKISVLEYFQDGRQPEVEQHIDIPKCKSDCDTENLRVQLRTKITDGASFRLYVVEDLSRGVIEVLGTELGIEPDFFRAHIVDYAWFNIRDRWRGSEPLELIRQRRNWSQIRYVTARYFENEEGFKEAAREAKENFNILRRLDDDKSGGWWDTSGPTGARDRCRSAVVALTRSRATIWLEPNVAQKETGIGKSNFIPRVRHVLILTMIFRSAAFRPDRLQWLSSLAWPRKLSPGSLALSRPRSARKVAQLDKSQS